MKITDENFAEKFLEILSNPKNSSVKDMLSDGLDNEAELGYNIHKWETRKEER